MYSRLVLRLSVISIFIFSLDIFSFNLKHWIEAIPILGGIYIIQGLSAIILFMLYLSTIWYFAHPAYKVIFGTDIGKKAFITGNIRFNIPVIFPWLILSLFSDLVHLSPWPKLNMFLDRTEGQIVFLVLFLIISMIFLPVVIQYFWGCKPVINSPKAEGIRKFLGDTGFKYRDIVNWPLLEGKMMTAGIMGIIPRYRYILITASLMEILTPSELNSVMAHEAGHARYYHQLLLSLFFIGYYVLVMGLFDPDFYFTLMGYLVSKTPYQSLPEEFYIVFIAVPMVLSLIIYFRFIMGFFMRHFERQADTYAAQTTGGPSPIISALEKIAMLSGKTRDVPSWHHFSIKQRVEFLINSNENPHLIVRHKRLVYSAFSVYIAGILALSCLLYMTPLKKDIGYELVSRIISKEAEKKPDDIQTLLSLAMIYHEMERLDKAAQIYERIITLDRKQPAALNNLAWLLLTSENPDPDDIKRGFELAKEAVELERSPVFLDTLAEACWLMGNNETAIKIIEEAILIDKTGNPHYKSQLEKFIKNRIIVL